MLEFFVVLLFFTLILACIYAPAGWAYIRYLVANRKFEKDLYKLDEQFWNECRIVITNRLGEGSIQEFEKSKITFETAHKNQDFAVKSIMKLLNWFSKLSPPEALL